MEIHYSIELKDEGKNSSISYWADSFSIDEHRILRVKSRDCGDITDQIDPNERVIINDVIVTDEWDELIEDMERQKGKNNMDRIRNTSGNIDFSHIDFIVHKSMEEMIDHNTEDIIHNTLEYCMCNGIDFTKMSWDEVKELENEILNK